MEAENSIDARFKKVFLEIETLERQIEQHDWGILFENRNYDFAHLMKNAHYENIYNFTRKIGDDVTKLYNKNKINEDEKKTYVTQRLLLDSELYRIHMSISEADPHFWEATREIFNIFEKKIMLNLPAEPKQNFWKKLKRIIARLKGKKPFYYKP